MLARCWLIFLLVAAALQLNVCEPIGNIGEPLDPALYRKTESSPTKKTSPSTSKYTESTTTRYTATTATTTRVSTTTTSLTTALPGRLGSFLVIGDWGWDPDIHGEIQDRSCQQAVADTMAKTAALLGDLKFVVNVGDSFYPGGVQNKSDPQWDSKWRNVYSKELRSVPWYSVYGNHDIPWDPYACSTDTKDLAQVNSNTSDRNYFYMPDTSFYVDHEDLKLEVIALDLNNKWVDHTCHHSPCEEQCRKNVEQRTAEGFDLFWKRVATSRADNLVIFSHYPTDYFWDNPEFLDELRNNEAHNIHFFAGHRHTVDQHSSTSIRPNDSWVSGGGGGWGCGWYENEQGFVVGEIGVDGVISTHPVILDFDLCCKRS